MRPLPTLALVSLTLALGAACDPEGPGLIPKKTVTLASGVTMAYTEIGPADAEAVIFLHGYTDTARSFWATAQALAKATTRRRLVLVDQRGHGASSMPAVAGCADAPEGCFRPVDMAEDLLDFMDATGIEHATLVGHSMGSFVAQEVALTAPERVDALVLIGTAARITGNAVVQEYILNEPVEGSWRAAFEAQGYLFPSGVFALPPTEGDPSAWTWIETAWVTEPAAAPELLAAIVPETAATKMGAWVGAARALLTVDHAVRLEALEVPALVLWGTQDLIFPAADQEELLARLDVAAADCASRYVFKAYGARPFPEDFVVDDIGHNTQWALPEAVAADIDAFLRTGEPTDDLYYATLEAPKTVVKVPGAAEVRRSATCD